MENFHRSAIHYSHRQRHFWLAPFLLLALLGCAREVPQTASPPVSVSTPSTLSLGLQARDGTAATGTYLILPLTWQASGEQVSAVEAELSLDPSQLELVGVQDESGTISHIEASGQGSFLVTTLLSIAAPSQQVGLVLHLIGSSPTQLSVRLRQAVDSQGRSADLSMGAPQRQLTITPGEGGQAEPPKVAEVEQQLQAIQQNRGLIDAQTLTVKPLKVPLTLDPSWSTYELGDIDQNRSVNLADSALLTRFLTGQQVPTSYQAYASDLLDTAITGAQQVDAADLVMLLAKNALTAFKSGVSVPSVHPLSVSANPTQAGLVLVGNAGYGPLNVTPAPANRGSPCSASLLRLGPARSRSTSRPPRTLVRMVRSP